MTNQDRWKGRTAGMRCKTCMFFVEKEVTRVIDLGPDAAGVPAVGRCRRRAPTMNGYPVVFEDDWCGDHKIDEVKIS